MPLSNVRVLATDLQFPEGPVVLPDGSTLAFGGQDQHGDDGAARTRLKVDGKWRSLTDELRKANPHQEAADHLRGMADAVERLGARARRAYLERAARLDEMIAAYNAWLPDNLRRLQKPRLPASRAAERFDAACPPMGNELP